MGARGNDKNASVVGGSRRASDRGSIGSGATGGLFES